MTSIVLTSDELRQITGRKQHRAQVQVLRELGIPYKVRADGQPIVARHAWFQSMGSRSVTPHDPSEKPDFSVFNHA